MPAHSRSKNGVLRTPMSRASTSYGELNKTWMARNKSGHDGVWGDAIEPPPAEQFSAGGIGVFT
jgi:hypothetical protein